MGVIHVVQPVFGATVLYRRFFTGTTLQYDSAMMIPDFDLKNKIFFSILGNTPREFSENMSSLQGPLELLPTNRYGTNSLYDWLSWEVNTPMNDDHGEQDYSSWPWRKTTRLADVFDLYANERKSAENAAGLYNGYGYDPSIRRKLLDKLKKAAAFHQMLNSNKLNGGDVYKHPNTYAIAGTSLETDVATEFDLKFESVKKAITYSEYQFTTEERYQPALERIKQFSRVPMAERNKFVADILRVISDLDFARLTKPIKPPEGDGTVPMHSAWGLFPAEADENKLTPASFNPRIHRQLTVSGVEHGAAFQNGVVTSWVHKLIVRLRNSPEVAQAVEKQEKLDEERKEKSKEEFIKKERLQKKVY